MTVEKTEAGQVDYVEELLRNKGLLNNYALVGFTLRGPLEEESYGLLCSVKPEVKYSVRANRANADKAAQIGGRTFKFAVLGNVVRIGNGYSVGDLHGRDFQIDKLIEPFLAESFYAKHVVQPHQWGRPYKAVFRLGVAKDQTLGRLDHVSAEKILRNHTGLWVKVVGAYVNPLTDENGVLTGWGMMLELRPIYNTKHDPGSTAAEIEFVKSSEGYLVVRTPYDTTEPLPRSEADVANR